MANLSVEEPDALMCARPGLWEPRVATPGATRPADAMTPAYLTPVLSPDAFNGICLPNRRLFLARHHADDKRPIGSPTSIYVHRQNVMAPIRSS